jgi:cysteine desulfuration protein SufE
MGNDTLTGCDRGRAGHVQRTICRWSFGSYLMSIEDIRSDFAMLDDWEDRYRYLIELGRSLPPLPDALRTDANKVRGCASQVWLASEPRANGSGGRPLLELQGDSDAHIVRGLIAVLFALFQGRTADEILKTDAKAVFAELGLQDHLTPQRSNGFFSMVERIRNDARALAEAGV